jgi:hypothetical protein
MEHSEAVETMAAERYALGEMEAEERDRFEEHFFDCGDCSQSVRDGATIASAVRLDATPAANHPSAVRSAAAMRGTGAPRLAWWSAAAAAALLAIVGYQNLVTIPSLRGGAPPAAHLAHPVSLLMVETRGGVSAPIVVGRDEEVSFYFDVPPETPYASYVADVRDGAGALRASLPIAAADAHVTVLMAIRPGVLEAGNYELAVSGVRGATRIVIAHYPFEVRFR